MEWCKSSRSIVRAHGVVWELRQCCQSAGNGVGCSCCSRNLSERQQWPCVIARRPTNHKFSYELVFIDKNIKICRWRIAPHVSCFVWRYVLRERFSSVIANHNGILHDMWFRIRFAFIYIYIYILFSSNIIENLRICETCKFQLVASDVPCFNTCSVFGETTAASRDKPKCTWMGLHFSISCWSFSVLPIRISASNTVRRGIKKCKRSSETLSFPFCLLKFEGRDISWFLELRVCSFLNLVELLGSVRLEAQQQASSCLISFTKSKLECHLEWPSVSSPRVVWCLVQDLICHRCHCCHCCRCRQIFFWVPECRES